MTYHYLVSSLPDLNLKSTPPFSLQEFFESNKDLLSPGDRSDIEKLINEQYHDIKHPFVMKWIDCETQLRNSLVKARTTKLNVDISPFIKEHNGFNVNIEKVVSDAIEKENPKEKELLLDKLRWSLLDELAFPNTFSINEIFSFIIKLKMVIRWAGLSKEEGRNTVNNIVTLSD